MTSQTIPVTLTGAEYTWPLTIVEETGKDISGCTIRLALGTQDAPGTWQTPDEDTPAGPSERRVKILVKAGTDPGRYHLWSKITDLPETIIRRHDRIDVT